MVIKKSRKYWQERFEVLERANISYAEGINTEVEKIFDKLQKELQEDIEKWYHRFATNNNITLAEAKKQLTARELKELKWDVQEYIRYGKENALNGKWVRELENASARFHINRLESIKLQTQQAIEKAFGNELDIIDNMLQRTYIDDFYRAAYEIQKGIGVAWEVSKVDQKKLRTALSKPWASDGKNFSDRIWQSKAKMVSQLHEELVRSCITGQAPDKAIKNMTQFVDGSVKNAKSAAGRIVMTEQAYFSSLSRGDCFNELDVEEYEILATLDKATSKICSDLDGTHLPMKDYKAGVTAPPFHPWCRTTTVPYFDDEWANDMRAARGEDGKIYYVPSSMKYEDWKKTFVDGASKDGLKPLVNSGTIEITKGNIQELSKLKASGMAKDEYNEYLDIINNHSNPAIRQLYSTYADNVTNVKMVPNGGEYASGSQAITFSYPRDVDTNKYSVLAHEYGHFFDDQVPFSNLHFKEMNAVREATGLTVRFKDVASSSDEFLEAIRKDKVHIKSIFTPEIKADLLANNASSGVQDAIDGLFPKSRIKWGHGEAYYNQKYNAIASIDRTAGTSKRKALQQVYKDLGFDANNQAKVKIICRQYMASSEIWANIMDAEVCGGKALEYVKKYLPNSYQAMIEILKGVK